MTQVIATMSARRTRWFKQNAAKRWVSTFALICADVLAFLSGYYLFRHSHGMPVIILPGSKGLPNFRSAIDIYLVMAGAFIFIRYLRGDYGKRQFFWDGAHSSIGTLTLVALPDISFVVLIGAQKLYLPLALSWLFLVPIIPIYRQCTRYLLTLAGIWQVPTALVGSGARACMAYKCLCGTLSLGFDIRYLIVENGEQDIPVELSSLRRINATRESDISSVLHAAECSQVIVTPDDAKDGARDLIQHLLGTDIDVAIIPTLKGLPLFGMSTNYLFGQDMLLLQLRNNLSRSPSRALKRAMDLIGPVLILILSAPVWLAAMAAIKLQDGGPIFFVQRRVGRNGHLFGCMKFRTMEVDAEERLVRWQEEGSEHYRQYRQSNFKLQNDPRVTRVGKWLRRFSIDELPQLLNVLTGQMSLVGPRPLIPRELPEYGAGVELYQRTLPGITGLWQISGRSETKFSDRVASDEWYILNWSLWYDIVILIKTVRLVLLGKGAF